ncbi:MAG: hypothetical protein JNN29_11200 [Chitinophagaceae bacterium]|nr:hypothetical protein [Chitinophagaceae bacterium]
MMYLIASLQVSIADLIMLTAGGILLGVTVFYFISSRRSNRTSPAELQKVNRGLDEWKRKYFNDIEAKEKQLDDLSQRNLEHEENMKIYMVELNELRKQVKELNQELKSAKESYSQQAPVPVAETSGKGDYMAQLRQAQNSLLEHNEKINQLLEQIDVVKENEERQQEIIKTNEALHEQIEELRNALLEKESEITHIRQKQNLTSEMTSMLDNAYTEFNTLQSKMVKLETQLASSKILGVDYEDLKEANIKMSRQLEETRSRAQALNAENQQLQAQLNETEEKLRESNFQRQQLQKRVGYLEELNNDLKQVTEANKKLEGQIKRIGELESMLHMIAEERDQLRGNKK